MSRSKEALGKAARVSEYAQATRIYVCDREAGHSTRLRFGSQGLATPRHAIAATRELELRYPRRKNRTTQTTPGRRSARFPAEYPRTP